ncbi:Methyltransferase domain [Corynebacterium mustelae]|uniref:Methyltransferase domain n=2 Tax=Corynebacterium mustelae TaxID=571915 RepID=A0A0G3H118_9CORY|nr:Methyltransferase domain [Corynebacterium mustelae]
MVFGGAFLGLKHMERNYWNHNAAYHPWLRRIIVKTRADSVLDVGCGDGYLLAAVAPRLERAVGVDVDSSSVDTARVRCADMQHVEFYVGDFLTTTFDSTFDVIVFSASIHHMNFEAALRKARSLLNPGGTIAVIGLARNNTLLDYLWDGIWLPIVRLSSVVHREIDVPPAPIVAPRMSLGEIKQTALNILPGAHIRRGLYYRYLLNWRNV